MDKSTMDKVLYPYRLPLPIFVCGASNRSQVQRNLERCQYKLFFVRVMMGLWNLDSKPQQMIHLHFVDLTNPAAVGYIETLVKKYNNTPQVGQGKKVPIVVLKNRVNITTNGFRK